MFWKIGIVGVKNRLRSHPSRHLHPHRAVSQSDDAGPQCGPQRHSTQTQYTKSDNRHALSGLSAMMDPGQGYGSGIHPSAVIDPSAVLGADVSVGALAVIGPEARIGAGSVAVSASRRA